MFRRVKEVTGGTVVTSLPPGAIPAIFSGRSLVCGRTAVLYPRGVREHACYLSEGGKIVGFSLDSEFPLVKATLCHLRFGLFRYSILSKIIFSELKKANNVCTRYT